MKLRSELTSLTEGRKAWRCFITKDGKEYMVEMDSYYLDEPALSTVIEFLAAECSYFYASNNIDDYMKTLGFTGEGVEKLVRGLMHYATSMLYLYMLEKLIGKDNVKYLMHCDEDEGNALVEKLCGGES